MEQIRIIKEMRKRDRELHPNVDIRLIRPRYMVWENVCGAFSSNNGEDFRAVLEETAKVVDKDAVIPEPPKGKWTPSGCIVGDGWIIAWRVHDAQFWGVPQRRKRISLVADFGGTSAPEILFERKSLSGNTSESGEKGQGITTDTQGNINKTEPMCVQRRFSSVNTFENGITPTLEAGAGEGGNNMPMVCESLTFQERAGCKGGGKGILIANERTGSLGTSANQFVCGVDNYNQAITGNVSKPLTNKATDSGHIPCVCYSQDAYDKYAESDTSAAIKQSGGNYGGGSESLVACVQEIIRE